MKATWQNVKRLNGSARTGDAKFIAEHPVDAISIGCTDLLQWDVLSCDYVVLHTEGMGRKLVSGMQRLIYLFGIAWDKTSYSI